MHASNSLDKTRCAGPKAKLDKLTIELLLGGERKTKSVKPKLKCYLEHYRCISFKSSSKCMMDSYIGEDPSSS